MSEFGWRDLIVGLAMVAVWISVFRGCNEKDAVNSLLIKNAGLQDELNCYQGMFNSKVAKASRVTVSNFAFYDSLLLEIRKEDKARYSSQELRFTLLKLQVSQNRLAIKQIQDRDD